MNIKVSFQIAEPGWQYSSEQIAEWLSWKLGAAKTISADNPLASRPLEIKSQIAAKRENKPSQP